MSNRNQIKLIQQQCQNSFSNLRADQQNIFIKPEHGTKITKIEEQVLSLPKSNSNLPMQIKNEIYRLQNKAVYNFKPKGP